MFNNTHFIGIGGIGMSALARILLGMNRAVSGSDISKNPTIEGLISLGANIHQGHEEKNLPPFSRVVFSSDISSDNPEYRAAIQKGYQVLHRSDLLAELIEGKTSLAVAGTHGKTTTSSLLATVLMESSYDPSFAVGGIIRGYQSNAHGGKGDYFVLEADESDGSFLKYHPFGAIITNIDYDHLVNFNGSKTVQVEAFKLFISQISSSHHIIWNGDDPTLRQLNLPGLSYGFNEDCDWRIIKWNQKGFCIYFDLMHAGKKFEGIEIPIIGPHNVMNGAAVFALCLTLGLPEESIRNAYKKFAGILRRCEWKGEYKGLVVIDDYAHHPTEIKTTLRGIRKAVQHKKMMVVYQPHRYSRTKDCFGLYKGIFSDADELIITDIFSAGEPEIPGVDVEVILNEIKESTVIPCTYVPRLELTQFLTVALHSYDVLVTLGAGDVTKVGPEILNSDSLKESRSVVTTR